MLAAKSPEFRCRTLELISLGNPGSRVAKGLGIAESCLRRCVSIHGVNACRWEGLASSERKELVGLRRRNRLMEVEIEILERASACFVREDALAKQ